MKIQLIKLKEKILYLQKKFRELLLTENQEKALRKKIKNLKKEYQNLKDEYNNLEIESEINCRVKKIKRYGIITDKKKLKKIKKEMRENIIRYSEPISNYKNNVIVIENTYALETEKSFQKKLRQ